MATGLLARAAAWRAATRSASANWRKASPPRPTCARASASPRTIWDAPGGGRVFEYNRQPAGQKNYMITIGADGKMSALRQVLTPENFAKVQPGMTMEDVRKMLGKPVKVTPYALKRETEWDWRWLQPPNRRWCSRRS